MTNLFSETLQSQSPLLTQYFSQVILQDKLFHSYLLWGGNAQVKELFVQELNLLLNCENLQNYKPCNTCINCNWITNNQHPESPIILKPLEDSKKQTIVVDQTKLLLQQLSRSSSYTRIIYIPYSEQRYWQIQASNSLLKSIEEANPKIIFIFCANSYEQVLPTIKSRSQTVYCTVLNNTNTNINTDYTDSIELLNKIYNLKTVHELTLLATEINNLPQEEQLNTLNNLRDYISQQYITTQNKAYINIIKQLDIYFDKLKAFCNNKHALTELFLLFYKNK